ncbi:MAG: 30S ribosomal protein S2 [Patescibacteria group bacterium]|nr:30S ribosomal protein S2 [Patescibacteria group bacterium]
MAFKDYKNNSAAGEEEGDGDFVFEEKDEKTKSFLGAFGIDVQEMIACGLHLGHRTSKLNPKMSEFVLGIKNTVHIFDLDKSALLLGAALEFIAQTMKNNGNILVVGTKPPLKELVKSAAKECGLSYVVERWLGGAFTNFEVIAKRAQRYKNLLYQKESGEFEKYTKKERIKIEKELQKMGKKFEGLADLTKMPEAVFVCDSVRDKLVLKEAKMKKIKTIAIVDTNADPSLVDYPIPVNDDAISSVKYVLDKVKETVLKNKK